MNFTPEEIKQQVAAVTAEIVQRGNLNRGSIFVVGCSTSEIVGGQIGKSGSLQVAAAVVDGLFEVLQPRGIFLAAQCCEHLNRALVVERATAAGQEIVCAVPKMHAGGSFATTVYGRFCDPVLVEQIAADAGLDIGLTLIGMHLKRVAVPVRPSLQKIGCAALTAAVTRPKYIGGERAQYV